MERADHTHGHATLRGGPAAALAVTGIIILLLTTLISLTTLPARHGEQRSARQMLGIDPRDTTQPIGRGIAMGHVEGILVDYHPPLASSTFDRTRVQLPQGAARPGAHARMTAQAIYGQVGLAPGVNDISFQSADHWLGQGFLRAGLRARPWSWELPIPQPNPHHDLYAAHIYSRIAPARTDRRVFTHSWISNGQPDAPEVLRRLDYAIDTQNLLVVVGVNNGRDTAIPSLLASSYNAIAVGQWEGNNSGGPTRVEGAGRSKPDLVAPGRTTSMATAVCAAVVARLLEAADAHPHAADAGRSQVIKAILLTAADKPIDWTVPRGRVLDTHYGAGRIRFDRSLALLRQGHDPAAPDAPLGWMLYTTQPRQLISRPITLDHEAQLTVSLAWHRRVLGVLPDLITGQHRWVGQPRLAHFDLLLFREAEAEADADGTDVDGTDDDRPHPTDRADDAIPPTYQLVTRVRTAMDNIAHLHLSLPPGRYRIAVYRRDRHDEPWPVALTWRIDPASDAPERPRTP